MDEEQNSSPTLLFDQNNMASNAGPDIEENSLDLHLDISLPEITLESPKKAFGQSHNNTSPDGKASELLMSDERELLKDLMCFEDSARSVKDGGGLQRQSQLAS